MDRLQRHAVATRPVVHRQNSSTSPISCLNLGPVKRADKSILRYMNDKALTFTEVFQNMLGEEEAQDPGDSAGSTVLPPFSRDDLVYALEHDQFEMFYQPKIRAADRVLAGAEALLRWNHPQRGLLSADQFIGIAEKTDFIQELGAWVVRQVSQFNAQVRMAKPGFDGRISLNVSPEQFNQPAYLSAVLRATESFAFPNHLLEIELTETGVLQDLKQAGELMTMIRSYGISIAIDDFGTGFSSLQILPGYRFLQSSSTSASSDRFGSPRSTEKLSAVCCSFARNSTYRVWLKVWSPTSRPTF